MKIGIKHLDWMQCIWDSDLPSNSKFVCAYLNKHMNREKNIAWPSLATICGHTGLSKAAVCKHLNIIQGGEWLLRDRGGPNKGSTKYIIGFPKVIEDGLRLLASPSDGQGSLSDGQDIVHQMDTNSKTELLKESLSITSDKTPACQHQKIVQAYHDTLPELQTIRMWTDKRKKLLKARWDEDEKHQDIDFWVRLFEYISASDFLMGRVQSDRSWKADLEWILNPNNFVKIIEGKYENRGKV